MESVTATDLGHLSQTAVTSQLHGGLGEGGWAPRLPPPLTSTTQPGGGNCHRAPSAGGEAGASGAAVARVAGPRGQTCGQGARRLPPPPPLCPPSLLRAGVGPQFFCPSRSTATDRPARPARLFVRPPRPREGRLRPVSGESPGRSHRPPDPAAGPSARARAVGVFPLCTRRPETGPRTPRGGGRGPAVFQTRTWSDPAGLGKEARV